MSNYLVANDNKSRNLAALLLVFSVCFFTLTFQLWFTSSVKRSMEYGWFRQALAATADLDIHSEHFIAPVAYRVLTPLLANAIRHWTGVSLLNAFKTTGFIGLYLAMFALGWLLLLYVDNLIAIVMTLLIFSFSFPFRSSIVFSVSTDPWTWFFLIIATGLALKKRWKWFAVTMLFGALNRETQIFLIPATAMAVGFDRKNMLHLFVSSLPAILITLLLRLVIPVQGLNYTSFYLQESFVKAICSTLSYHGINWIFQLSYLTFGTLWFIGMLMSRSLHKPENRFFWGLFACAHFQLLFAVDVKRLVSVMLPLLAIQTGRFLDDRLQRHHRKSTRHYLNYAICLAVTIAAVLLGWSHFVVHSRWRFGWMFYVQPASWVFVSLTILLLIFLVDRVLPKHNKDSLSQ